jgi:hypothetical protein
MPRTPRPLCGVPRVCHDTRLAIARRAAAAGAGGVPSAEPTRSERSMRRGLAGWKGPVLRAGWDVSRHRLAVITITASRDRSALLGQPHQPAVCPVQSTHGRNHCFEAAHQQGLPSTPMTGAISLDRKRIRRHGLDMNRLRPGWAALS